MFVPTATFPVTKVGDNAAKVLFGTLVWRSLVHGHETWFIWVVLFQWELAEPPLFGAYNHGHWVVVDVVVNDFLGMYRGGIGKHPCFKIICLAVHLFEVSCWCGTSVMSWKGEVIWNRVSLFEKQMTGLLKSLEIPWSFLYSPFSICFWREKNGRVEFNFGTSLLPKSSVQQLQGNENWRISSPTAAVFVGLASGHSFLVVVGNRGLLAGRWMFP